MGSSRGGAYGIGAPWGVGKLTGTPDRQARRVRMPGPPGAAHPRWVGTRKHDPTVHYVYVNVNQSKTKPPHTRKHAGQTRRSAHDHPARGACGLRI